MSLIVTGSIGIDTVITPHGKAENILGGSCTYFAAAASFFGPVRIVAAVGEDFPDKHVKVLEHFKVDLRGLEKRAGSKTFAWQGKYHENMNVRDTISVDLNVLAEKLPPVPAAYKDSRYVFLANTDPVSQMTLLEQFPDARLVVADTMDLWINTQKDALLELLKKVDALVLNDAEAFELTGKTNIVRAGEAVLALGPKFVVIKKGEHGVFLLHGAGVGALPAYAARDVVDPTGAGDSFAGGMMGYLAAANETGAPSLARLRQALAYGTIVASFNIESFSLQRLMQITRADIDRRLAEYGQMLAIGS